MMSITRIGGTDRYSDVVLYDKTIYLSGVVPTYDSSLYEQAKEVLERIDKILISSGSSKKSILNMTIYLKDENSYEEMNRAFDEWIPKGSAPARATIGNIKFPNPMWKIEITVIACVDKITKEEIRDSYLNYVI
jgi:enamine deaminase RidA (YjgF/YER057c/UK114 family)